MSIAQKKIAISIVILVVVGVSLLVAIFSDFSKKTTQLTTQQTVEMTSSRRLVNQSETKRRDRFEKGKQLRAALLAQKLTTIGSYDPPEIDHNVADWEYKKKRRKTISPFYWETAPKVLDEILDSQSPDVFYAKEMKKQIEDEIIEGKYRGTVLEQIECGETICKATFFHDDNIAFQEFQSTSMTGGPWGGDVHGKGNDSKENSTNSILFFSKEGYNKEPFEEMREIIYQRVLNKEI